MVLKRNNIMNKTFGLLFIFTGIFAFAGSLYTWGVGNLFQQTELLTVLIPFADLILTAPLSLICGYGILKNKTWGNILGLLCSGIYLLGSFLVFITIIWNRDYSIYLIIPSISGFFISVCYLLISLRKKA